MELFTNQVLAGIATGAIYACMALAVVMIYQAIDHLNFAQGEMAMFSTFISWQMMQWGVPYWGAFVLTLAMSFAGGIADRAAAVQAARERAGADPRRRLHRVVRHRQLGRRPDLGLHHQAVSDAVRILAVPRQPADLDPSGRHDRRDLLMLVLLFCSSATRASASRCGRPPRSLNRRGWSASTRRWMIALGWGMAAAIGSIAGMLIAPVVFLEPNMMGGVLIYGFAGAVRRRADQPARRGGRRLPGRRVREPRRHLHSRRRQRDETADRACADHHRAWSSNRPACSAGPS